MIELTEKDSQWAKGLIRRTGLFSACTDDELSDILNGLEKKKYDAGAVILMQGEISSRLGLIVSGKVSITVRKDREKNKIAELEAGAYFGEISLLTPRAATATVKAEEAAEIIFLPGESVRAIVKNNEYLSEKIHCKIDERLAEQEKLGEENN